MQRLTLLILTSGLSLSAGSFAQEVRVSPAVTSGPDRYVAPTISTLSPGGAGLKVFSEGQAAGAAGLCQGSQLARLEPERGNALGVYVDEQGLSKDNELTLGSLGGNFAVYFRYWRLTPGAGPNLVFPDRLASAVKKAGGALHIALEPSVPLAKLDDATLKAFAVKVGASGVPTFVRFASEMNDPRNEWSKDPERYKATWIRLWRALKRDAPEAAMVWMPMATSLASAERYYPGAGYVDWVGLSLYSMPYLNGSATQSGMNVDPLEKIAPFYQRFSCAHPVQISEYGASSRSGVEPNMDYSAFAVAKMRALYWGSWWRYPRLKNINWLHIDMHTSRFITQKDPLRFNDYSLLTHPGKREAFRELSSVDYFKRSWGDALCRCSVTVPVAWPKRASGLIRGAAWINQAQGDIAGLSATLDERPLLIEQRAPYRFEVDASQLVPGQHQISLTAYSTSGSVLERQVRTFDVP